MSGNPKPSSILSEETGFFEQNRDKFVREHPNQYLLIKGRRLIGSFDTQTEAVNEGIRLFCAGPFLVRKAGEDPPVVSNPALSIGVALRADIGNPV